MAKEVQKQIVEKKINPKAGEEEFFSVLKLVAPGTNFRLALDGILKMRKGALIMVENEFTSSLFDGGFRINARFTPQKLMELSKMDGAIILSKDMKKINNANVLLTPNSRIYTPETGTRHKAAERSAKEAGTLTVAISERRGEITLYYKNLKHPLADTNEVLMRANEKIQLLEKQRELFESGIERLNILELKNYFSLKQAINVIQKGKLIQKIVEDLKKYSVEIGKEGTLFRIRLKEIISGVEKESDLVIKDYTQLDLESSKRILSGLSYDEILDEELICKILNYETPNSIGKIKGWRFLSKTSLSESDLSLLLDKFGSLVDVLNEKGGLFLEVLGEEKTTIFKEELDKMKRTFSS